MSNRLIYQVKVGPTPPKFYDTCIDSVKRYCQQHNIEHHLQTEPKLKIRPLKSKRSEQAVERLGYLPIFEKENAFDFLDRYDEIAVIDSDIYIREDAPNVFDELEEGTAFAGVLEKDLPLADSYKRKIQAYSRGQYAPLGDVKWDKSPAYGYAFYNMGLMVFTSEIIPYLEGQSPEEFIRRPEFERFVNGEGNWRWSTDQTLMNYWVRKSGMKLQNLDWRWNTLVKGVKDDMLSQSYFLHFFLSNLLPRRGEEIPELVKNLDKIKNIKERT